MTTTLVLVLLTLLAAPAAYGACRLAPLETTQAEYQTITGAGPSQYRGPKRPVENVSWWDAIRYCNLRSEREGLQPAYDLTTGRCDRTRNGYRLPSDAEWEAAAAGADPKQSNLGIARTKDPAEVAALVRDKGTRDAGQSAPSATGHFDMLGNVWEWTDDATHSNGIARIIRGGSFVSTVSQWARGYRSSMDPGHRSRYLGFRVCRTEPESPAPSLDFTIFNQPPPGFETSTGTLTSLLPLNKPGLLAKWRSIVGAPSLQPHPPTVRHIDTFTEPHGVAQLLYLQTEPDSWEKILIVRPKQPVRVPTPVVIVPYYDVDTPAARHLGGRNVTSGMVRAYAQLAAERGFIAVAIRWFGESYGERYDEAVANLALRHPDTTGLGKWVWDAQRLVDYLYTLPDVDRQRIGIIGHSLGAKMALYAAALDDRIGPVVFSEGGIGFSMSNYDDYWYLSAKKLQSLPAGTDQHELLALIAPRPFLLIGGDEYDGPKSWHYINAAKAVYQSQGAPRNIGYFNHHTGHSPTPEAIEHAMRWLVHFLR